MAGTSSLDNLVARLQAGDRDAECEVVHRFANRLLNLAQKHLDARVRRVVEPEDVMWSALRSFFVRNAAGHFELKDWNGLWGLVAIITIRKCIKSNRRFHRDMLRVEPGPGDDASENGALPWEALSREPTPDQAALVTEAVEQLMRGEESRGRQILTLRFQGYSNADIAETVGCSERTVRRVVARAKTRLERSDSEPPCGETEEQ